MWTYFKVIRRDRWLLYTVVGYTYFWFAGALIRENAMALGAGSMHLDEAHISYVLGSLAIGIGTGALAAGYLSRGKIETGLVPIGTIGLAVMSMLLAIPHFAFQSTLLLLFGLGFFAGMFDVPLAATIQYRSPEKMKGGILAATNMLTFLGMLVAGALYLVLSWVDVNPYGFFFLNGLLALLVGIVMFTALPSLIVRGILWLVMTFIYRVRVRGRENFPLSGGALLASNHISYIDAMIIMYAVDRPVRFLIHRVFYDKWYFRFILKGFNAIPVSASDPHEAIKESLEKAHEAVMNGEVVCIFPEGGISRRGILQTFLKGYERIMRGTDAPIIPVHLDNIWGSIFSYSTGKFFFKRPERLFDPVSVHFGAPMPPDTPPERLRAAVLALQNEDFYYRKLEKPLLHRLFIKRMWQHPRMLAMADVRSGDLSCFKACVASFILARKLNKLLDKQPMVGLLVPPTIGGALANIALQIMGRVPVNLNYTASDKALKSAAAQCNMTQCITAKAFLERVTVQVPANPVYLEDILKSVTALDRVLALLMVLIPVRISEMLVGAPLRRSPQDLATVIFSSGSEGDPKGVMLTHYNILSDITNFAQAVPHKAGDRIAAFLPFFHSFGFTGSLWAGLTISMSCIFHPNPLETKAIGEMIKKYGANILIATPTFLQNFVRRSAPEDLRSLRLIYAGAEKLSDRVREAFKEKFGVEPLEGYGATECSPVISVNVPDFVQPQNYQVGNKHGSVGRPLPAMCARVTDPDTGEVLPEHTPGLLQVRGPNIMKGYLGLPEKTAAVLKDGWYSTGDIAIIDMNGFITITDRLARFSKIAGEMVSHTKVEEILHKLVGLSEQMMAVSGVPDSSRGERLVVLHTLNEDQLQTLLDKLDKSELPYLWRPRPSAFYRIEAIPVLGTGKMDIRAVKDLAAKLDMGE
jgi:acyl-[acyl-carrier-protein]-phospholipid O-acyltransferase/long-chain-fatty-acid--[acyl-carrier-protein] ligase